MNEELNNYDSVTKYTPDDFKAGFQAGLATVGALFIGIKNALWGG